MQSSVLWSNTGIRFGRGRLCIHWGKVAYSSILCGYGRRVAVSLGPALTPTLLS